MTEFGETWTWGRLVAVAALRVEELVGLERAVGLLDWEWGVTATEVVGM